MISVVCVYNDERTLKDALLKSLENQTSKHELILVDNTQGTFKSAAEAYNWGGAKAESEYIMFVHQDVDLCSDSWLEDAEKLVKSIPNLGIAGVGGAKSGEDPKKSQCVTNIKHGIPPMTVRGALPLQKPERVQTVDECLVLIPRHVFDMLQFDEEVFDNWHLLYTVDYSLSVARLGLDTYVIPAFIHHWSPGKFSGSFLKVIASGGDFPAGYYRILGRMLKKHRSHIKRVYGTTGSWSTSYPLTLVRANEVLRAVFYKAFGRVLFFVVKKGIVAKPRNACKRILSAVWHFPNSDT